MARRVVSVLVALGLVAWPGWLPAQSAASDPEVAKGVRQVDEGDYDAAIVTLDAATRRLAADPSRGRDLSQAYLYLGIAYVGKGHEAAAKAKFREALARVKDLTLSADRFPPKVIDLFEAAKEEAGRVPAPGQAPVTPVRKKGGSKGLLIIGGVAAAAGVGIAVAGGGGGGATTGPTPGPTPQTVTQTFEGLLNQSQSAASIPVGPAETAGPWRAELQWSGERTEVRMFVLDPATGAAVGETRLLSPNSSMAGWEGAPGKTYEVQLFLQEGGASQANYILRVTRPR